jgi:RHS repeat-associated protein
LDYYPYGSTRVSSTTGAYNEAKQFIAQYADPESSLSYLQARYYDGSKGQFLSEDPVFWGDPKQQNLRDPQSLNSYLYGNGNPIVNSDPTGNCAGPLLIVCIGLIGANTGIWGTYAGGVIQKLADGSPNAHSFDMTLGQVGTAGTLGFVEAALLPEKRVVAGVYAAGNSLAADYESGAPLDARKAGIAGVTGLATGKLLPGSRNALLDAQAKVANNMVQNASILITTNWANIHTAQQRAFFQSVPLQNRNQATQSYNAAVGASTPESRLWTTPNGAVINWSGIVIAAAPSAK